MITGTHIYTWFRGELVGTDEFGNRYFRGKGKPFLGREKRWVLFSGGIEASKVPPEWHAWLHHTVNAPLTETAARAPAWQKEHRPNRSGTLEAYRPAGHQIKGGHRAPATGDYQAWTPGQ